MVLRGIAVQLNFGLTAPKIGRPLCPARHTAQRTAVSCPDGAPTGIVELNSKLMCITHLKGGGASTEMQRVKEGGARRRVRTYRRPR